MTKPAGIGRGGRRAGSGRPLAEEKAVPLKIYVKLSELREAYESLESTEEVISDAELLAWARVAATGAINRIRIAGQEKAQFQSVLARRSD